MLADGSEMYQFRLQEENLILFFYGCSQGLKPSMRPKYILLKGQCHEMNIFYTVL